ncbi:Asp-tRNA(Asn)/Glu-tRNA(Gln) amidotransferase subunit GatB [Candidatus Dependentiae bacterium]|nr:Asp-tRNA(Asn)/Glu-tRNA(Gln) amidotransferase subunit GatB [Candidatus Dependentiae bacterium]
MTKKIKNILDIYPEYEANIGIEVHTQLKTKSKIFCSCPNQFGSQPNKNICPTCAGYPGVLPNLNRRVVDSAITLGLATKSQIARVSEFARKHYMYPDLPKNFQITQDEKPICTEGYILIELNDATEKQIRLVRIHIEEDAGKNLHIGDNESYVDLNRAGTPLLEIVSHPDMTNAYEAKTYLMNLRAIVQYLDISDANMEEGSFRADVNVSVKKKGAEELGTKVEVKNINSFKFISQAINYEIERQIHLVEENTPVTQETRTWDEKYHKTVFMRTKEEAFDYRYFSEPDLPIIVTDDEWVDRLRKTLPELPHQKYHRFQHDYELSPYEANILVNHPNLSAFFEATTNLCKYPKQVCNWILRNLLAYLNEHKLELHECKIRPETLSELIIEIEKEIITSKTAQEIFLEMAHTGKYPSIIVQEQSLKQISSKEELEPIIAEIIENNSQQVEAYKQGNERLFTFFIGQTMKVTKGKGNPKVIKELLEKYLR